MYLIFTSFPCLWLVHWVGLNMGMLRGMDMGVGISMGISMEWRFRRMEWLTELEGSVAVTFNTRI